MGVTKQEGQKQYAIKRAVDIALAILLIIIAVFAVNMIKKDFTKIDQTPESDNTLISSEGSTDTSSDKPLYVSEAIGNEMVNHGSLILVNSSTEYKWNEDGLKSLMEVLNEDGTDAYSVIDNDVKARTPAAAAMNSMLKAFSEETGHKDIRIDSAYRSVDEQQSIYDNAADKSTASEPGYSDYHTGYSIDLNVVDEEGNSLDFDAEGDYEWFKTNCYKYGFVFRFPEGKEELTGQSYRPWHFRYVGSVHASYMKENNLCLEEYINKLKSYPYSEDHLEASDMAGNKYEIYYYAADFSTALTSVAVPSESEYEISGNNSDGFIITIPLKDSSAAAPESSEALGETSSDSNIPKETEKNDEVQPSENNDESSPEENDPEE